MRARDQCGRGCGHESEGGRGGRGDALTPAIRDAVVKCGISTWKVLLAAFRRAILVSSRPAWITQVPRSRRHSSQPSPLFDLLSGPSRRRGLLEDDVRTCRDRRAAPKPRSPSRCEPFLRAGARGRGGGSRGCCPACRRARASSTAARAADVVVVAVAAVAEEVLDRAIAREEAY